MTSLPAPTGVPRWLELQAEGDYCLWRLKAIAAELRQPASPIEALIDEASGRLAGLEAEAVELMQQFDSIQAEMAALLGASDSLPVSQRPGVPAGLGLVPPTVPNPVQEAGAE